MSMVRIWRGLQNIVRFARITATNDGGPVLTAQIRLSYLETFDGRPVVQQFGFSSNPPVGSDAVLLSARGDPAFGIVVGTNHQASRPTGKVPGESGIYNNFSMRITLTQNGIVIDGGGKNLTINNVPILIQNGDIHATGAVIAGFGGADQVGLQTHRHTGPGGNTGAPIAGT